MPINDERVDDCLNRISYCEESITVIGDRLQGLRSDLTEHQGTIECNLNERMDRIDEIRLSLKDLVKEYLKEILQNAVEELNRTPSEITLEEFESVLNDTYF